jgi:hypothetical protein
MVKKILAVVVVVAIVALVVIGGATEGDVALYVSIALGLGAAIAAVVGILKKNS